MREITKLQKRASFWRHRAYIPAPNTEIYTQTPSQYIYMHIQQLSTWALQDEHLTCRSCLLFVSHSLPLWYVYDSDQEFPTWLQVSTPAYKGSGYKPKRLILQVRAETDLPLKHQVPTALHRKSNCSPTQSPQAKAWRSDPEGYP